MDCSPTGSSVHGDFPGKNTGVGCHALLQGSSQPRDQAQVVCIVDGFFTAELSGWPSSLLPRDKLLVTMASSAQWTWVWVNSRSWWWTGKPGVLWFMGSQGGGHDWVTKLNWTEHGLCSPMKVLSALNFFSIFSSDQFRSWVTGDIHNWFSFFPES